MSPPRRRPGAACARGLVPWLREPGAAGLEPGRDIALAVDAVEILHTQRPDWFAIASSDADFTPLVMHLREHGAKVYGFGDAKTPQPFQSACTRFLVLNRLAATSPLPDAVAPVAPESAPAAPPRRRASARAATVEGATTNAAESLLSRTRHVKRNVKRWRGGQMMLRWVAAGVLEAVKGFRRVKGHADMPRLVAALRARDQRLGLGVSVEHVA